MSQTKPLPKPHNPSGGLKWRVFSAGFPRGDTRSAKIIRRFDQPFRMAKITSVGMSVRDTALTMFIILPSSNECKAYLTIAPFTVVSAYI